jgi:hypothetical protein
MPVNYANGIIYKLCCRDATVSDIYIGSTTSFRARKARHKSCCNTSNKSHDLLKYVTIRENGGWDNWCMVEIEKYNAADKRELLTRERHWIEQLKPSMNKEIPGRTHAEQIKQYAQQYFKQSYQDNPEKHKQRSRKFYQDNAEKHKQRVRQFYQDNAEKIKTQQNQKHDCDCGGRYSQSTRSRHFKSKKHIDYTTDLAEDQETA